MISENNVTVRQNGNQSINRAVQILKCFEESEILGLADICRMTGLPKSTVFGIVSTLEKNRLMEQDGATGKYRLGIELFRLGTRVNMDLCRIAAPSLDTLVAHTGETVNFATPDGTHVVYIDKRDSVYTMRIAPDLGRRRPMFTVATGKSILAALPEKEALAILKRTEFVVFTDNTLQSIEEVMEQLREVRQRGYAINRQELDYDRVGIAAAVCDYSGRPVAAVSIAAPVSRMDDATCARYARHVVECAREISRRL